jgi:hypothetical protein
MGQKKNSLMEEFQMRKSKSKKYIFIGFLMLLLINAVIFGAFTNTSTQAMAESLPLSFDSIYTDPSAFEFNVISSTDKTCSVKLIDKNLTNIRVPETVVIGSARYKVTEVVSRGFSSTPALETIILPKSVVKIGSTAFQNCANLEMVYAPMAQEIGMAAFAMCPNLTDYIFPETITSVGSSIFLNSPTKVHARFAAPGAGWSASWNSGNTQYSNIQSHDFFDPENNNNPWLHPLMYEESPTINLQLLMNNGTTSSANNVNNWTKQLSPVQPRSESIDQGPLVLGDETTNGILNIANFAFCDGTFSEIIIHESVTGINIESYGFYNVHFSEGLSIDVPTTYNNNDDTLSTSPFNEIDTPFFQIPATQTIVDGMFYATTANNIIFTSQDNVTTDATGVVEIPNETTIIMPNAFAFTQNISDLYIPSTLTAIGTGAFEDWESTQTIHLPYPTKEIADTHITTIRYGVNTDTWTTDSDVNVVCKCNIPIDNQGGSGETVIQVENGEIPATITPPIKEGFIFDGYYTGINGSGTKFYGVSGNAIIDWNESLTMLYAKWISGVDIDNQGGNGITIIPVENGNIPASITKPTKAGYNFDGYYTGTNGSGTKYYDANGNRVNSWTAALNKLYAKWIPNVAINNLGGSGTTSLRVENGNIPATVSIPEKTHYVFEGYYTGTNGSGTKYYDSNGIRITNWNSSLLNLYAKWTDRLYRVTISKGGGTGGPDYIELKYGQAWPSTIIKPTRAGAQFKGYYHLMDIDNYKVYNSNGVFANSLYIPTTFVYSQDITIHALWDNNYYYFYLDRIHYTTEETERVASYNSLLYTASPITHSSLPTTFSCRNSQTGVMETRSFQRWRIRVDYDGEYGDWLNFTTSRSITINIPNLLATYAPDATGPVYFYFRAIY